MPINHQLLDQRLAALRAVPTLEPAVIDRLAALLRSPDDWACFRVNPRAFASEQGLEEAATLDVFIHASRLGLLDMRFNLICPGCGGLEYEMTRMDAVPTKQWHCVVCQRDIEADLDDRVEVSFTADFGVRTLELGLFDSVPNYMRGYFSNNFLRSPELQAFVQTLTQGIYTAQPGQAVDLAMEIEPGRAYRLLSLDTHSEVQFPPAATGGARSAEITVLENGFGAKELALAPGTVALRVVNRAARPVGFMALGIDWDTLGEILAKHPNRMRPFLTAKMLLNNQTFRDVYRVQHLDADLRLRLRSLTLLFTDLKGSTELYDRTGDLRAYAFVREHFKVLSDAVKRNRGAIIKTMGDAIMASFNEPTDAARAALEMMRGMDALNASMKAEGHDTGLKVGLHEGPALAVTAEERLDYFGQTVNVAARVQGLAQAGEIWLTPSVMEAPGVGPAFQADGWSGAAQEVSLKGVGGRTKVFRLERAA